MTSFAQYLRAAMDERGWNQADLARASGLSPKSVSEYISKGVIPRADRIKALARGMGVPEDEVRKAADMAPSMGDFRLTPERQADAETLSAAQRHAVEEIIRLLADGNRKKVTGGDETKTPLASHQADYDLAAYEGDDGIRPDQDLSGDP